MTQALETRPIAELPDPKSRGKMPLKDMVVLIRANSANGLATAVDTKRAVSVRSWYSLHDNHNPNIHLHQRKDLSNPETIWMWLTEKGEN